MTVFSKDSNWKSVALPDVCVVTGAGYGTTHKQEEAPGHWL